MNKKVLILSGSPRKGGNSDLLCDEFMRGALESGNEVEKIRITQKNVSPCSACYYCRDHGGVCVHKDDMADILQKMVDADVLVLATVAQLRRAIPRLQEQPWGLKAVAKELEEYINGIMA